MNVPKLRFKEFTDEWTTIKLSDIGEFLKGGQLNKSDLSLDGIPCILYGELYTFYNEFATKIKSKTLNTTNLVLSKKYDILLPLSGETAEDISTCTCVFFDNIALGGDLIIFRSSLANNLFISLLLKYKYKYKIAQIAQGKSVVHINIKNLKNIKTNIPNLEEQKKLSDFIFSINKKITNLENIITNLEKQKKGLLQQIFSQKLRFKDENGNNYPDWEKKKLGDLFLFKQGYQIPAEQQIKIYKEGYLRYLYISDFFSNKNILYVKKDNMDTINKSDIVIANTGNTSGKFFRGQTGILSNNMFVIKNDEKIILNDFLFFYLETNLYDTQLKKIFNSSGQPHLGHKNMSSITIIYPQKQEQIKIINLLSAFDRKINNQKAQLEHWKQIKKGLLQQMFV